MTWIARIAAVAVALTSLALVSEGAQAQAQPQSQGQPQAASDLTNSNIEFAYYPSGHMIYLNVDALKQLKSDLAGFYSRAVPNNEAKGSQ